MKKLYLLVFPLFIFQTLQGQSKSRQVQVADTAAQQYLIADSKKKTGSNRAVNETESYVNGFAKVMMGSRWGFADNRGRTAIPARFEQVRNFSNHLAAAKLNSKWGFINENGKTVIPFEYDIIYDFTESLTAAFKNNKWHLVNKKGTVVKTLDAAVVYGFNKGKPLLNRQEFATPENSKGDLSAPAQKKNGEINNKPASASSTVATQALACPRNIGFDLGNFSRWNCFTGTVASAGINNIITVNPSLPTANRHVIYPAANPSALDPYGLFPINPPDGSGFALKLGNDVNGSEAERVQYTINVPANAVDYSITYRYAVVFQDPGHLHHEQPRFSARLLDVATNTYLPCASYEYVAEDTIPGFYDSPLDPGIKCKTWAPVFVNLSAYAGKTLILEFTSADCTLGAHWGYTYVDVGDCNIAADVQYQCNPNIANLTGPPGFRQYRWWNDDYTKFFGNTNKLTLNPAPDSNSMVHIEVIPYNGAGCSDTLHVMVGKSSPAADAGPDKWICPGASANIGKTTGRGNTYSWFPADHLSNPNSATPVARPPVTTTYIVTVSNPDYSCDARDTVTVFVNPEPDALFDPGNNQCLNENYFSFNNNSAGAVKYDWNLGDGTFSSLKNPSHSYTKAGTYTVKLITENSFGCKDSMVHTIKVNANPTVAAGNDGTICLGNSIQLKASGAQSYEWSPAQSLSCSNCANPVATPAVTTAYNVRGISAEGCSGFDTITITVHQPIQITVSPGKDICKDESVNLQATGGAYYRWSPKQGLNSDTIAHPVATPAATTSYRVIGFDGNNCFTDTGYVTITVNPKPTIELGPDKTLLTGTHYRLDPVTTNGPIVSWLWTPATELNCSTCPNPIATIKKDITYHAEIENIYGCKANDKISIKTFCENTQVYVPNAFTPDGDGINDILMVRASGIEVVNSFRIFSRWGELLFEKRNFLPNTSANGWDGKIKGKTGAPEVYVYTLEVTCDNLQTYTYKGNVSILK